MPIWLVPPAVVCADPTLVAEGPQIGTAQAGAMASAAAPSRPTATFFAREGGHAGAQRAPASYPVSFLFEKVQGLVNPVGAIKMLAEIHMAGPTHEHARPRLLDARGAAARAVPSGSSVATAPTELPVLADAVRRDVVERAAASPRRAARCGTGASRPCRPYPLRIPNVP
jgi:hypothetical protein